jgi:phage-related protein
MGNKKFKTIIWIGSSLEDLQNCHEAVKDEVGYALHVAQQGEK